MISRIFSCKFLHIETFSVSGHSVHLIFKTCQIVAGTSMIRQFHEFFEYHFWRVFVIWCNCVAGIHGESLRARGLRLFYEALLWVGNDACKQPKGKAVWGRGLTINLLFFLMFFKTASSKKDCAQNKFCQIIWVTFFTLWFHEFLNCFSILSNSTSSL